MSFLTQRGATGPLEIFKTSTDPSLVTMTGAKFYTSDGREFALVQNAGTALASGKLVAGPDKITNHQNLTTATAAIGATQVTVTLGATLATANQYSGGYVIFNAGTGSGQTLKIASHPAAAQSATLVLTLEDPVQVATAVSDTKSCLVLNPFGSPKGTDVRTSGVQISPVVSAATPGIGLAGAIIGVSTYPIAASSSTVASYGLIQTSGVVAALSDGGTAIGLDVMPGTVAGSVATYVIATSSRVGTATQAGVDLEYRLITLQL